MEMDICLQKGEQSRKRTKINYADTSDNIEDYLVETTPESKPKRNKTNEESISYEAIDKILDQRIGKKGATGIMTMAYNVTENGDPNDPDAEDTELQYLIKWADKAHIYNTWETEDTLKNIQGFKKLIAYMNNEIEELDGAEKRYLQKHLNIERVIAKKKSDKKYIYLCKWEEQEYNECTWESQETVSHLHKHEIEKFEKREISKLLPKSNADSGHNGTNKLKLFKTQPPYIGSSAYCELKDYQLFCLNWLSDCWFKGQSAILADEMGLGKTIQTIAFFAALYHDYKVHGPFLIIVPLSTLPAWQIEFAKWAPQINVVTYYGTKESKAIIRKYEWYQPGSKKLKFNALICTYETILSDKEFLSKVKWAVLAVDEAHRLKNGESLLHKNLALFSSYFRLLITGTPLQNTLKELWALLHFIMPEEFENWDEFESTHKCTADNGYEELHSILKPLMLKRLKKDVEKAIPAKRESILTVPMTNAQKRCYKLILTKDYSQLSKGNTKRVCLSNLIMELKKCCNHVSLIQDFNPNETESLSEIISGSGKLLLLHKLLCKLKDNGHRVLIFSQMVIMLDIIENYLMLQGFTFQRLDGAVSKKSRKRAIDHFNEDESDDFCFLLSTRAGGLGINLTTADTVIIYDSDWNPQNDLQALARAHRIGQKKTVNVYRFVTKESVEESILERAKNKMVLDHLIVQRLIQKDSKVLNGDLNKHKEFNKEELSSIVKFGAEELFKEDPNAEEPIVDIDDILKHAKIVDEPMTASDELLSSYKNITNFDFNEEEEIEANSVHDVEVEKEWSEIIPLEERLKFEEEQTSARRKRNVAYSNFKKVLDVEIESPNPKKRKGEHMWNEDEAMPKSKKSKKEERYFNKPDIQKFITSYCKFPEPSLKLDAIIIDAGLQNEERHLIERLAKELDDKCKEATASIQDRDPEISENNAENQKWPQFELSGYVTYYKKIWMACQEISPLKNVIPKDADERAKWICDIKVNKPKWNIAWTLEDDSALLKGIYDHGMGNWQVIKDDSNLGFTDTIFQDIKSIEDNQLRNRSLILMKRLKHRLEHPNVEENGNCKIDKSLKCSYVELKNLAKSYQKFCHPLSRIDVIVKDAGLQDKNPQIMQKFLEEIHSSCLHLMKGKHDDSSDSEESVKELDQGPNFKLSGYTIHARKILKSVTELEPLSTLIPIDRNEREKWDLNIQFSKPSWTVFWDNKDDIALLKGVYEHGMENWMAIKNDPNLGLTEKIIIDGTSTPQMANLKQRVYNLSKTLKRYIENADSVKKIKEVKPVLEPNQRITKADIKKFIQSIRKFAHPLKRIELIINDAGLQNKDPQIIQRLVEELEALSKNIADNPDQIIGDDSVTTLHGYEFPTKTVASALKELVTLGSVMPFDVDERDKWSMPVAALDVSWKFPWNKDDDASLLKGVYEHGMGNWEAIKMIPKFGLADKILLDSPELPQQLRQRATYLLKTIRDAGKKSQSAAAHLEASLQSNAKLSHQETRKFIASFKKFADSSIMLDSIINDAGLQNRDREFMKNLAEQISTQCRILMAEHTDDSDTEEDKGVNPTCHFNGVAVQMKSIIHAQKELEVLNVAIPEDLNEREEWTIEKKLNQTSWGVPWSNREDSALLKGIYKHGMGNWDNIKMDEKLGLSGIILPENESSKPQRMNLRRRFNYLRDTLNGLKANKNRSKLSKKANNPKSKKEEKPVDFDDTLSTDSEETFADGNVKSDQPISESSPTTINVNSIASEVQNQENVKENRLEEQSTVNKKRPKVVTPDSDMNRPESNSPKSDCLLDSDVVMNIEKFRVVI